MTENLRRALRELPDPSRNVSPDFAERVIATARRRRRALRAGSAGLAAAAVAAIVAAGVTLTGTSSAARIMPVTPPATSSPAMPSPSASASPASPKLSPPTSQAADVPLTPPSPTFSVTYVPPASPAATAVTPPPSAIPTTPPPVVTTTPPPPQTCLTAQLVLNVQYLQGAGGDEYDVISLGNVSNVTCTLTGYPAVVLTDAQGKTLAAGDSAYGKPADTITLPSGGFASTFLHSFPNACTTSQGAQYTYSATVTVTPPGNTAGQTVADTGIPLCQNSVEPLQTGAQPTAG